MRCWWICFWKRMNRLPSRSFWIWMPPTISCTGDRKGVFIMAITTITAICRCPISMLRPIWSRQRRVIAKAEHIADKANPRFVVTSLSQQQMAAQEWYEKGYCARGECPENRIKEQQLDLFADRTSTGKMWSNQLRLYFSSIAYVLLQTLRRTALAGTELAKAQCGIIRLKLLKIGAQIRVTVRKVWVSLSEGYPHAALFAQVLATLEAG